MNKLNMLVIDDEAVILRLVFKRFPATVSFAANRAEAERQLASAKFDVILMDGQLDGWVYGIRGHGPDVVRRLRADGVTTRIVMFSASEDINEEGLAAGADESWSKKGLRAEDWMSGLLKVLM